MQALSFVAHIPLVSTTVRGRSPRVAVALLIVGFGFTTIADSGWAHGIGVAALLGFVALAFPTALPREVRSGKTASRRID